MGASQSIGRNLARPDKGIYGWAVTKFLAKNNAFLENNAVKLCNIQPDFTVLEVGFGPGIGLQHAHKCVKGGSGVIHGTDISDRMRNYAKQTFKQQIAEGKIHIHAYSVTNLLFDNDTFDCVFHCNCYYFWPDMDEAVAELRRVMKPGCVMVATLSKDTLAVLEKRGMMTGNIDPKRYMNSLRRHGFTDVNVRENFDEDVKRRYNAIVATSPAI